MRPRRAIACAFTLTEVMVVALMVLILIALMLPGLAGARRRAVEFKCTVALRSAFTALTAYAGDYREVMPFAGDNRRELPFGENRSFFVGGVGGLSSGRWSLLLPDEWAGDLWNPGLMCPRQAPFDPSVPPTTPRMDGSFMLPTLWLSGSTWLDAASLMSDLPFEALRTKPNILSNVAFPSMKACFFEQVAWCASGPDAEFWKRTAGQTPHFRASANFFDGSVTRVRRSDGLAATHSLPFDLTIDGVRGRDIQP